MKRKSIGLTASLLALGGLGGMSSSAMAVDWDSLHPYLFPSASYSYYDGALDDELGWSIAAGLELQKKFALELSYDKTTPNLKGGGGSVKVDNVKLDALYYPIRDIMPVFGLIGYGQGNRGNIDTRSFEAGVGYFWQILDNGFGLRTDYRYRYTKARSGGSGHANDNIINVGVVIPLIGYKEEVAAPPPPPPPPPPSPPPPAPAPAIDLNQTTPIILEGVKFPFDSAKLVDGSTGILDEAADALNQRPDVNVLVRGYTDWTGTNKYNLDLSKRRAASVKTYLEGKGVAADRMYSQGFGKSHYIAPNTTKEGRHKNRRVELQVVKPDGCYPAAPGDPTTGSDCLKLPDNMTK